MFVIHLRGHKFGSSNHRFGKGLVFEGGQAQVTNLDRSGWTGDENVVAFEISVDNRRRSSVQKMKAFENLSAPEKEICFYKNRKWLIYYILYHIDFTCIYII